MSDCPACSGALGGSWVCLVTRFGERGAAAGGLYPPPWCPVSGGAQGRSLVSASCLQLSVFSLRSLTKNLFNPQFGSIFRTFHNPTYFSRRLVRFSDIYMASISCLLNYDVNFTFYPRRTPLQHEAPLWMDQLCTGCMKTPFLEEMVHIR